MKLNRPAQNAHSDLKRWEGREQRQTLGRYTGDGPIFFQKIKSRGGDTLALKASLIERFLGELVAIRLVDDVLPEGVDHAVWILRGGFNSLEYGEVLVRAWSQGKWVPNCYRLRKRLTPQLESHLISLNGIDRMAAIETLRVGGILPQLRSLSGSTCPAEIPWELVRHHFQDFQDFSRK